MPRARRDSDELSSQPTVAAASAPGADAPASSPLPLEPGSRFADYEIVELLGRGGMGVVYKCRHRTLARLAALKVLTAPVGVADQRFLREARAAARLDHHNIVTVYNAGQERGLFFIEMQLVDGQPLAALLEHGPVAPPLAARYVEQVAHALAHAHACGIVHRDIKPDNILLAADDVVKVTDFGLAKHSVLDAAVTSPGSILGTPCYMAPEQWHGEPTDARTDLYALGATFYQLLVGRPPYVGKLVELLRHHTEAPIPIAHEANPAVPSAASQVVARLMAKRPQDRYQSAAEAIADLRRLQQDPAAIPIAPPTAPIASHADVAHAQGRARDRQPSAARTRWLAAATLAAIAFGVVVGLERLAAFERAELRSLDRRMTARRASPPFAGVTLLLIDDDAARELGMPVPRDALADAIDAIERAGARAIALDLLIADADPGLHDAALLGATAEARHLVHAMALFPDAPRPPADRSRRGAGAATLDRHALRFTPPATPRGRRAALPFPALLERARMLGHVDVAVDHDGVVRRLPALVELEGRVYPTLSLAVACHLLGAGLEDVRPAEHGISIAPPNRSELAVPLDRRGMLRLSVRGDLERFDRRSLARVVGLARDGGQAARRELARAFSGRVVFVGTSASGQADVQPMPGMPVAPLVLAHATALETIMGRDFIRDGGTPTLLAAAGALALIGVLLGLRLPPLLTLGAAPAIGGGYWLLCSSALARAGLALPLVAPGAALALAAVAGAVLRASLERRQRQRLADALGRYLPRKLAQRILADPDALKLGGKRTELTVLCVELHGFAALSERLEPEEVGRLLQSFFAAIGDAVARHGGTLDRFDGDGVRAFFGDPLPQDDHARRAVACALEIRRDVTRLLEQWAGAGLPRPHLGVGASSGYVTVGNIGTLQRMEYTVVGRHVEHAARLARAARDGVLVSARTRALARPALDFAPRPQPGADDAYEPASADEGSAGPRDP